MARPLLTGIDFHRASQAEALTGLLGWVSCVSGAMRINGITVRRTCAGRITLSFPEHRDRRGGRHPRVLPVTEAVREQLEDEILSALPSDIAAERRAAIARGRSGAEGATE